jgi:hypothetical protein
MDPFIGKAAVGFAAQSEFYRRYPSPEHYLDLPDPAAPAHPWRTSLPATKIVLSVLPLSNLNPCGKVVNAGMKRRSTFHATVEEDMKGGSKRFRQVHIYIE